MGKLTIEEIVAKINRGATELNLRVIQHHRQHFSFSHFKSQGIELEMKEGKPLVRHSRQTLHSRNLIFGMIQHQHFSFTQFQATDNKIGIEGWKAIAEALKTNTSLTELNLGNETTTQSLFIFTHLPNHRQSNWR